jgi:mannosyltransferase
MSIPPWLAENIVGIRLRADRLSSPNVRQNGREAHVEEGQTRASWPVLVTALAGALRLFRLGTKSFWLDETESLILAQLNWHDFIRALVHRQANMTLYYLLLRAWIHLGSSEFAVRCLSALAGVITIPAIYFLGKSLFGPKTGRLAALLLGCVAFHIRYSQEARSYSLFVLLAVLSTLFFVRALRQPSAESWVGYALLSPLMVYAQVFGYLVLVSQWASLFWLRDRIDRKRLVGSLVSIHLLIAPLAFCLLVISDRSQLAWLGQPSVGAFSNFLMDLTGNGGPVILLLCALLSVGAIRAGKLPEHAQDALNAWKYSFLLIWLLLPAAALLALSIRWPSFTPRFLIPCLVPLVLLVAEGVTRMPSRVIGFASLLLLLGSWLNADFSYYRSRAGVEHTDDWRDTTSYVLSQAQAGDAVLFTYSEERLAFDEYQQQFHMANAPIQQFPEGSDIDLLTQRPSRPTDEMVERIANSHARVWVLSAFQPDSASRRAAALLGRHFVDSATRNFGFVRVDLFVNR